MKDKKIEFSKQLVNDIRSLLWVVTVGGVLLAFYCVYKDYTSSLPWISSMVGLPWASHATVCSLYLNKSKAENTSSDGTGITFAKAQAQNFIDEYKQNVKKYQVYEEYSEDLSYDEEYEEEVIDENYINSPPI